MKSQINLLNQLQEFVLTRDEHHQMGDGSRMDALDASIDALVGQLEPHIREIYMRLYKRNHIVMSPMCDGMCAVCGMKLPISQVQQVRMAKTMQLCTSCGRMLYNAEDDAPRYVGAKSARAEARKAGISRFSAEELCVTDLMSDSPAGAIRELADKMVENRFISNAPALVSAAMERESILSTATGNGMAFPHVRGVEGGGLTLALGISKRGIAWDDGGEKVNLVFFTVIPTAVSPFYLRLMASLTEGCSKPDNVAALLAAPDRAALWKAFMKATRYTVK